MSVKSSILSFLREPQAFSRQVSDDDKLIWLNGLTEFAAVQIEAKGDHPLRPAQIAAWQQLADHRLGLILGPPGTGKTYALSWMALGYLQSRQAAGLPCRILVSAFTLNAIGNVLEAIREKAHRYLEVPPSICFVGSPPSAGLHADIVKIGLYGANAKKALWDQIGRSVVVIGCSVWSLNRVLRAAPSGRGDGYTAPLFDLLCIDEASQTVVSQGLMALAGLSADARVLVAGDDKQLPPVRPVQDHEVDGRRLGGSLYDFLKSAGVVECPLDETFRLNAPLTHFPETKFYPGRYRSATEVRDSRLALRADWKIGLEEWEKAALDPETPVCILLHDGPTSGTSNAFEANLVARLVAALYSRLRPKDGEEILSTESLWQTRLAVISPHRAQNAAIRAKLAGQLVGVGCVVETVDRIQGKERDAIIASYTVSDPEFALAEADFIFSTERLNVAITRARTKLILVISRRLLDVVPPDEDVFDAAQILREFVFDTIEIGQVEIDDGTGRKVPVNIRARGFGDSDLPIVPQPSESESASIPTLTPALEELLAAIKQLALSNAYGTALVSKLKGVLFRDVQFSELLDLLRLGYIQLDQKTSQYGAFWTAKALETPRIPFNSDETVVRQRLEEVVNSVRSGRLPPFYNRVRDRFVWVNEHGDDVLMPTLEKLAGEGLVRLTTQDSFTTVEWIAELPEPATPTEPPPEPLSEHDFITLNCLEDSEAERINFGVFEAWQSARELANHMSVPMSVANDALRRLATHGHVMIDDDGRVRSRMAELARELRYVKQRFSVGDAARRPYLVRSLKVEMKTREKPTRDQYLADVIHRVSTSAGSDATAVAVLRALDKTLQRNWHTETPQLARFQERALEAIFFAWRGKSLNNTFVISADTGSGKTEAACLPLIAGAACDALGGVSGVRAIFVYPRIRLSANQAQRIVGYLATFSQVDHMPLLTLGLQNAQVPRSFDHMWPELGELWKRTSSAGYHFPFFGCPTCGADLELQPEHGVGGADLLTCRCGWRYPGWVGSKVGLQKSPPHFFLCVTESLHQWQQNDQYGILFGDYPQFSAPRAVLADEIHLYTHIQGAQVGYALQRVLARAMLNGPALPPPIAIGMSATLGKPTQVWSELSGRDNVIELKPEASERLLNPRGREHFYFIQPEVESRGKDIAGASTTIQSLMLLSHGMRRRTGTEGGYRSIAFLDSIDKLKRLHGDYQDAEEGKRLAALRTRLYDDLPGSHEAQRQCCGDPASCDQFRGGECWYFAANDMAQITARGRYRPGQSLAVSPEPVFSGTGGRVEEIIKRSDIVFATSTLEVGYDDPDIMLVYQHYAPRNLASFIQRKGRGGRGADDRPLTAVTLSPYSALDSWYFRRPQRMLDESNFQIPLNLGNPIVVRGQALAVIFDALAHHHAIKKSAGLTRDGSVISLHPDVIASANAMWALIFGDSVLKALHVGSLSEFWADALQHAKGSVTGDESQRDLSDKLPWLPKRLFDCVNLPLLIVRYPGERESLEESSETIPMGFDAATPGNMTRRYGRTSLHWIPPKNGRYPWMEDAEYLRADSFPLAVAETENALTFLSHFP